MIHIPTTYRGKIRTGLSYPLGAEAISEALKEVRQLEELELSFHSSYALRASQSEKALRRREAIPVVTVSFRVYEVGLTGSNTLLNEGLYDDRWSLTVYPVPSPDRRAAQDALLDRGLPIVREWLMRPRSQTWLQGSKGLVLILDLDSATVSSSEWG